MHLLQEKMDPSAHNPRLKRRTGPWSSPGRLAERSKLCRQRGDRLSASPVLLSSVFSSFPVCLWPDRRALPCRAPLPARSGGSGWDGRAADAAAAEVPAVNSLLPWPGCSLTALRFLCHMQERGSTKELFAVAWSIREMRQISAAGECLTVNAAPARSPCQVAWLHVPGVPITPRPLCRLTAGS